MTGFRSRADEPRFAHKASRAEIADNDWNLNIPRYVETFEAEARIDLEAVTEGLRAVDSEMEGIDAKLRAFCAELGLEAPV